MDNFVKAVQEIVLNGNDLTLDFGVCKIDVIEKTVSYSFNKEFVSKLNQATYETKLKKSSITTSDILKSKSKQNEWIQKSNLILSKNEYNGNYPNLFKSDKTKRLDKGALDLTGVTKTKIVNYWN